MLGRQEVAVCPLSLVVALAYLFNEISFQNDMA